MMFGRVLPRVLFVAFTVIFSVYLYQMIADDEEHIGRMLGVVVASVVIGVGLVIWEWFFQRDLARHLVAIIFGLTGGLFASVLLVVILLMVLMPYHIMKTPNVNSLDIAFTTALWQLQFWLPMILSACLYVGVTIVLQTRDDFRFLIPYVDLSQRSTRPGGILLDSSVFIDGRVVELANTGIFTNDLLIPDYVVRELQKLADSADSTKRARGRRGLEIVKKITELPNVTAKIRSAIDPARGNLPVDQLLMEDAKGLAARILTTDYNLGKVGTLFEGVKIINVNEISYLLKNHYNAGDSLDVTLVKKGQEPNQAVGYLDDGTMIVVENGIHYLQTRVQTVVTGCIQTNAGRMLFAKIIPPVKD